MEANKHAHSYHTAVIAELGPLLHSTHPHCTSTISTRTSIICAKLGQYTLYTSHKHVSFIFCPHIYCMYKPYIYSTHRHLDKALCTYPYIHTQTCTYCRIELCTLLFSLPEGTFPYLNMIRPFGPIGPPEVL
jgi:hypothetical protein